MDEDERFDQQLFLEEHKLYMGNIPTYLTENEVRKMVEAIGPIKYFNLVRDSVNGVLISRVSCCVTNRVFASSSSLTQELQRRVSRSSMALK